MIMLQQTYFIMGGSRISMFWSGAAQFFYYYLLYILSSFFCPLDASLRFVVEDGIHMLLLLLFVVMRRTTADLIILYWILKRLRKSWLHPSAANVCNRGKGEKNVYDFLYFHFLSAVVPVILSYGRQSVSRAWKLRSTGLEGSSF